ncbi:MAG: helix-turn-helix transcriptional regulator [Candidatus Aminicenantes bacterium]|nr:helix-turn-helix transcriptional regulator [Candidatus Aminicenantes bacterium]
MEYLTRREEQVLLSVHFLKGEAYLIPIREQIKTYTGKYYSVGTIYAPLNRLLINGFLDSYVKKLNFPLIGKPIKFYKLTKKGYKALADLSRQNARMWKGFEQPV